MRTKFAALAILLIAISGCTILYQSDFAGKGPWGWDVLPTYGGAVLTTQGADLVIALNPGAEVVEIGKACGLAAPSPQTLNVTAQVSFIDAPCGTIDVAALFMDSQATFPTAGFGDPATAPGIYTWSIPLNTPGIVFPIVKVGLRIQTCPEQIGAVVKVKNIVFSLS